MTQDLLYGIRQLRSSPTFTAVAVLSLALGIGANTAIFQLVDAIRLKTLPVKNPEELAYIDYAPNSARAGWWSTRSARLTYANWERISAEQQGFSGVMAWSATRFNLSNGGEPRYAEGLFVSGNFFGVLGTNPIIGRTFTLADDTPACANISAVISHAFWQREFGGSPAVVGRTVSLEGHSFPIAGVTPAQFFGVEVGRRYDVAIPLCADKLFFDAGKGRIGAAAAWWLSMIGRLKPGWTIERANTQLKAISPGIMRATLPDSYKPELAKKFLANKLEVTEAATGVSGLRQRYERPLWILMATTGLVLLIACANLANLLLARASVREREITIRLAIGASRWRLIRQLLVESLLLAFLGAGLGAVLARVLSRGLIGFITTGRDPLFVELGMDWRVLAFTTALGVVTCLLFGLLPAFRATRVSPVSAMRSGGRGATAGRERSGLRRILVATQVALSLVLLAGSLLFVRSLRNLLTVDAGFQSEGIVLVNLNYTRSNYAKERRPAVIREIQDRLSATPGVLSAAQVGMTPVSGSGWNNDIGPDGSPAAASGKESWLNRAGPGYFKTMGIGLIAGREFNERDTLSSPQVAIVNETFARKYYNSAQIVGRTFRLEAPAGKPEKLFQIVGVVKNTKYYELREDFRPQGFFPTSQDDDPGTEGNFVLRVAGSPLELMNSVKREMSVINPLMSVEFRSLSAQLQDSLLRDRLMAALSGGFAFLAVLLSTLGLYGVIAYMVARRRNEIGVRIALGADRARVILLVLRETAVLLGAGLAVGLTLAYWTGQTAATLLYGIQPFDPASLATAVLFLVASAMLATYAPARRAATLEPMKALRDE
jgi:predicted permease